MSLLHPRPGEIIDRLTILELKIENGAKKNVETSHWEAEKVGLQNLLHEWEGGLAEELSYDDGDLWEARLSKIAEQKNGLAAVNGILWNAEDEVRVLPQTEAFKLAALAKNIASWNDARARHIRELDKLYGVEEAPEKLHKTAQ